MFRSTIFCICLILILEFDYRHKWIHKFYIKFLVWFLLFTQHLKIFFLHKFQVNKNGEIENIQPMPVNQYNIVLHRELLPHESYAFLKSCESLAFLVRDAAHITTENFECCVHCIRTFVEASTTGGKLFCFKYYIIIPICISWYLMSSILREPWLPGRKTGITCLCICNVEEDNTCYNFVRTLNIFWLQLMLLQNIEKDMDLSKHLKCN